MTVLLLFFALPILAQVESKKADCELYSILAKSCQRCLGLSTVKTGNYVSGSRQNI